MKTQLGYIDEDICRKCGGECCKNCAGIIFPDELKPNIESEIIRLLRTENYAIDWWDGDIEEGEEYWRIMFVRPAHKNAIGKIEDASWGGECVFFKEEVGCKLKFEQRPHGCRMLEPKPDKSCKGHSGGKEGAAKAWRDYQDEIKSALAAINVTKAMQEARQ